MGRTINGGGDQLARGAARATFRQPNVTKEKYEEAVNDFDFEKFMRGDADSAPAGGIGRSSGEAKPRRERTRR